jgi:hypothetical protein
VLLLLHSYCCTCCVYCLWHSRRTCCTCCLLYTLMSIRSVQYVSSFKASTFQHTWFPGTNILFSLVQDYCEVAPTGWRDPGLSRTHELNVHGYQQASACPACFDLHCSHLGSCCTALLQALPITSGHHPLWHHHCSRHHVPGMEEWHAPKHGSIPPHPGRTCMLVAAARSPFPPQRGLLCKTLAA